jgi:hypothetical protein
MLMHVLIEGNPRLVALDTFLFGICPNLSEVRQAGVSSDLAYCLRKQA